MATAAATPTTPTRAPAPAPTPTPTPAPTSRKNRCRFCTKQGCPRPAYVDYKDVNLLKKMCTNQGRLLNRKRSGNCAAFQRAVSEAVKRARFMALLPYIAE